MPELPEVNTLTIALAKQLRGDAISVWHRLSPKLRRPIPDQHQAKGLIGREIVDIKRVGKSIFFDFAGKSFLKIHLGMTGYFYLAQASPNTIKHAHLQLQLNSGRVLTYCDPRRFGIVEIAEFPREKTVEPFIDELTAAYLKSVCSKRECSIKALIMNQQIIAGLGNIYATEALFKAGIRPDRAAGSLKPREIENLCYACIEVIAAAIKSGKASLGENPAINENTTHFAIETLVYGQQSQLCPMCLKSEIEMIRISGRSSCHCPTCQK